MTNTKLDTLLCEPVGCELVGVDGNAFSLMAHWRKCAKKAGRSAEEIKSVLDEAMCNDYNHLIWTLDRHSK